MFWRVYFCKDRFDLNQTIEQPYSEYKEKYLTGFLPRQDIEHSFITPLAKDDWSVEIQKLVQERITGFYNDLITAAIAGRNRVYESTTDVMLHFYEYLHRVLTPFEDIPRKYCKPL